MVGTKPLHKRKKQPFDYIVYAILTIVIVICVFPLMYVISVSITPMVEVQKNGGFLVIPKAVTFTAYKAIFQEKQIPRAMLNTVLLTVAGTSFSMIISLLSAYALSKSYVPGRKMLMSLIVFTMMFGGGVIPTYLLIKSIGMMGSYLALIVPSCVSTYNMIVLKAFFENLPDELFESGKIDGASEYRLFWKIAMPLSKPVIMTVMLFYAVSYWETYFASIMYIPNQNNQTLQVVIRRMLTPNAEMTSDTVLPTMTLQMATVVFSSLPIVMIYPFIQKYFTQGIMLGAIKG